MLVLLAVSFCFILTESAAGAEALATANPTLASQVIKHIGVPRGICVILGDGQGTLALELARQSELLIYMQLPDAKPVRGRVEPWMPPVFMGPHLHRARAAGTVCTWPTTSPTPSWW